MMDCILAAGQLSAPKSPFELPRIIAGNGHDPNPANED
jgi:hypothetical protein